MKTEIPEETVNFHLVHIVNVPMYFCNIDTKLKTLVHNLTS